MLTQHGDQFYSSFVLRSYICKEFGLADHDCLNKVVIGQTQQQSPVNKNYSKKNDAEIVNKIAIAQAQASRHILANIDPRSIKSKDMVKGVGIEVEGGESKIDLKQLKLNCVSDRYFVVLPSGKEAQINDLDTCILSIREKQLQLKHKEASDIIELPFALLTVNLNDYTVINLKGETRKLKKVTMETQKGKENVAYNKILNDMTKSIENEINIIDGSFPKSKG